MTGAFVGQSRANSSMAFSHTRTFVAFEDRQLLPTITSEYRRLRWRDEAFCQERVDFKRHFSGRVAISPLFAPARQLESNHLKLQD
jgi:hypothetical protein